MARKSTRRSRTRGVRRSAPVRTYSRRARVPRRSRARRPAARSQTLRVVIEQRGPVQMNGLQPPTGVVPVAGISTGKSRF